MLYTIILILVILWLLGFAFSIGNGLIHILIVIALVIFVVDLINKRR